MKVFIPASSHADSSYLLYKMLKETDHEISSVIFSVDASKEDITNFKVVCDWLSKNVREFRYEIALHEKRPYNHKMNDRYYLFGYFAKIFKAEFMCIGYNTHNWQASSWFFQTDEPSNEYFRKGLEWHLLSDPSIVWDEYSGDIHLPFMSRQDEFGYREETPVGRWEIWENIPEDLRNIVSKCDCGKCNKCTSEQYYLEMKSQGFDAKHIDDEIMKMGGYGPYYTKDSVHGNRDAAYRAACSVD